MQLCFFHFFRVFQNRTFQHKHLPITPPAFFIRKRLGTSSERNDTVKQVMLPLLLIFHSLSFSIGIVTNCVAMTSATDDSDTAQFEMEFANLPAVEGGPMRTSPTITRRGPAWGQGSCGGLGVLGGVEKG